MNTENKPEGKRDGSRGRGPGRAAFVVLAVAGMVVVLLAASDEGSNLLEDATPEIRVGRMLQTAAPGQSPSVGFIAALIAFFARLFGGFGGGGFGGGVPAPTPAPSQRFTPRTPRPTPPPTPAPIPPPTPLPLPTPPPTDSPTFDIALFGTCTEPEFEICIRPTSTRIGQHCGLTYEIFGSDIDEINVEGQDLINSCMTLTRTGFQAQWSPFDGNYLARKAVRPGSRNAVITYQAEFRPTDNFLTADGTGFSLLGAYGFTLNPLTEYYVVENWGTVRPPVSFEQILGTVFVDGALYDQFLTLRVNKPSVAGTQTFFQFWSVRQTKRLSGTINLAPHFAAWESRGYDVGNFFEVSFLAEGLNSVGFADVDVIIQG